jgi:hypothetical protein
VPGNPALRRVKQEKVSLGHNRETLSQKIITIN